MKRSGALHRAPGFWEHVGAVMLPRCIYKLPPIPEYIHPTAIKADGTRLTQKQIRSAREKALKEEAERDAKQAADLAQFEEDYKRHLAAIKQREAFKAGVGNVVGGLANTLGHGAVTNLKETGETLVAAGGALAQGRIVTATAEIGTQAVRVVANTATGAAKLGVETVKNVASTLVTGVQGTLGKIEDTVDPIQLVAAYLQPVQARLASALIPLRGLRGVLCWHDPALTTWLVLFLIGLTIVLPFLPWLLISRTVGILMLGPHMWWVGSKRRKSAAEAEAKAEVERELMRRYASERKLTNRTRLLDDEKRLRDEKAAEEAAALEAEEASLPFAKHAEHRKSYGKSDNLNVHVRGSRVADTKLLCLADVQRSSAHPFGSGTSRAVPGPQRRIPLKK